MHDLVDYASLEAEAAGLKAARYDNTGKGRQANIPVDAGRGYGTWYPSGLAAQKPWTFP